VVLDGNKCHCREVLFVHFHRLHEDIRLYGKMIVMVYMYRVIEKDGMDLKPL